MALRITIGIATWNRSDLLAQTLDSLTRLHIPAGVEWEVLVCDNNSTDNTRAVVEAMASRLPVRYLFEGQQGKSHALNHIIRAGSGEWIIFSDDDVQFDLDWLASYVEGIVKYEGVAILGGQVLPWLERPMRGQSAYLLRTFPWVNAVLIFDKDVPIANQGGRMPYGNNMAVRRDLLLEHSFDARSTMRGSTRGAEDTDLVERLLRQGHTGWMLHANKVHHFIPRSRIGFKWFCKWHRGAGAYWIKEKGPAPAAKWGVRLWLWKLVALRLFQAAWRWRPGDPRKAYECIADALSHIGYAQASDQQR